MSFNVFNQCFDVFQKIFELVNNNIVIYIHSIDMWEYDVSSYES